MRFPSLLRSSIREIISAVSSSLKNLWTVERGQVHFWARYLELAPNFPRFTPAASSSIPAVRTLVRESQAPSRENYFPYEANYAAHLEAKWLLWFELDPTIMHSTARDASD